MRVTQEGATRAPSKKGPVSAPDLTLGFFMHGFRAGRKSSIFGVWTAPAAGKTLLKGWALLAPSFGRVFPAAGAAQTPEIYDFRPVQNHVLKTRVKQTKVWGLTKMGRIPRFVCRLGVVHPRRPQLPAGGWIGEVSGRPTGFSQ